MQYDGVDIHGPLHRARMRDVVERRSLIEYRKLMLLVSAIIGNREKVPELARRLFETMFPGTEEGRLRREEEQASALAAESMKAYSLQEVRERDD